MSCVGRLAGRGEVAVLARRLETNGGRDGRNGIAQRVNNGLGEGFVANNEIVDNK